MEFTFQKHSPLVLDSIIKLCISNSTVLQKCYNYMPLNLLSYERKIIMELVYSYYDNYQQAPGDYIVSLVEDYCLNKKQVKRHLLMAYLASLNDLEVNEGYVLDVFSQYVREWICSHAIEEAKLLLDNKDYSGAEALILEKFRMANMTFQEHTDYLNVGLISLNGSSGFRERNFKTYIDPYDAITDGFYRKEFIVLFGDQNVGKSFAMVYFAKVALLQGKRVLFLTLETDKEIVKERFSMAFTSSATSQKILNDGYVVVNDRKIVAQPLESKKVRKVTDLLHRKKAKLWIEQPTSMSVKKLKSMINSIELFDKDTIDVLILDSLDQFESGVKYSEYRYEVKNIYKEILELTKERRITTIATTQAGRQATKKSLTVGADVSESYDKVRIPDTVLTLSQTEEEYKRGIARMLLYKSRSSSKYITIELEQALGLGQFVISSKLWEGSNQVDSSVVTRFEKELKKRKKDSLKSVLE